MAFSSPIPDDAGSRHSEPAAVDPAVPLLTPLRELELVEAFRRGDAEALAILLRAYQRRMYTICYRMLRHEEDARDAAQDCMIKVMEGLPSFDSRARLSTWIVRVTINCCISHLRKRKLRGHASIDQPPEPAGSWGLEWDLAGSPGHTLLEGGEPRPIDRVEMDETRRAVLQAVERLEPAMRAVLILRDMQDLDYVQIAEVLEVPVGTVKSRLFRARAALRELIEAGSGRD